MPIARAASAICSRRRSQRNDQFATHRFSGRTAGGSELMPPVYRTPRVNCWTPRRGLVNPTVIELLQTSAAITLGNLPRADAVFARFEQRRMRDRNDRERDIQLLTAR